MMLAWLSSSLKTWSPVPTSAVIDADVRLVARGEERARASVPLHAASFASSSAWSAEVSRDQPRGAACRAPQRSIAAQRRGDERGMRREAEIVVGAEEDGRAGRRPRPRRPVALDRAQPPPEAAPARSRSSSARVPASRDVLRHRAAMSAGGRSLSTRPSASMVDKARRPATRFVCQQCGHARRAGSGSARDCGAWSTLVEEAVPDRGARRRTRAAPRTRRDRSPP